MRKLTRRDQWRGKLAFSTKARMEFYQQVESFLDGGIPLHQVLEKLFESYQRTNAKHPLLIVLRDLLRAMEDGQSFSDALSRWAPASEIMLIRVGESSGEAAEAFRNTVAATEASKSMTSALVSGLAYPAVLLIVLTGMVYIFSVQAIPTLVAVKDPDLWPAIAKPLYSLSQFVQHFWWVVVLAVVSLVIWVVRALPTLKGRARQYLDRVPPFSFYRTFQSSVMLISVSAMMQAGVPLVDALESLARKSHGYVAHHLKIILVRLRAGRSAGEAFDTGFLPVDLVRNIRIYSELSTLDAAMNRIGRAAVEGGVKAIKSLAAALNTVIIIALTVYMGWVYFSFFTLMQSIGSDVGGF